MKNIEEEKRGAEKGKTAKMLEGIFSGGAGVLLSFFFCNSPFILAD